MTSITKGLRFSRPLRNKAVAEPPVKSEASAPETDTLVEENEESAETALEEVAEEITPETSHTEETPEEGVPDMKVFLPEKEEEKTPEEQKQPVAKKPQKEEVITSLDKLPGAMGVEVTVEEDDEDDAITEIQGFTLRAFATPEELHKICNVSKKVVHTGFVANVRMDREGAHPKKLGWDIYFTPRGSEKLYCVFLPVDTLPRYMRIKVGRSISFELTPNAMPINVSANYSLNRSVLTTLKTHMNQKFPEMYLLIDFDAIVGQFTDMPAKLTEWTDEEALFELEERLGGEYIGRTVSGFLFAIFADNTTAATADAGANA